MIRYKPSLFLVLRCVAGLLLLLVLLSPSSGQETKSSADATKNDTALTSLKKSLLIPGWGQFAEKHIIEGALFLGAEIFSLYQIFRYNHKGSTYYRKYQDAVSVEDALFYREKTEDFDKKRNLYILGAVGIWAVNLIDIYVIVKSNKKQKIKLQLQSVDKKGLVLSLHYSF